jgi:hypothetical protein
MNPQAEAIKRVIDKAERFTPCAEAARASPPNPVDMLQRFVVTEEQVRMMSETALIWRDVIAGSHLHCWAAPGNGGKTTIARFAAQELARDGFTVYFFQEDAGAGDLPMLQRHAANGGYMLMNSTLNGSTVEDQIRVIQDLTRGDYDLSNWVLFFDTLKKYCDLMNKRAASAFFTLMRGLTQRGATVILLGHTNKHPDSSGNAVFEGVGDVRNDVDELIYLKAGPKDERGMTMVTMTPDKVRSLVRRVTFEIDTNTLTVRPLEDAVDLDAVVEREQQKQRDANLIDAVLGALETHGGDMAIEKLVSVVQVTSGVGMKKIRDVIKRYASSADEDPTSLWTGTRLQQNNSFQISLKKACS